MPAPAILKGDWLPKGGRVMALTAFGTSLEEARKNAYQKLSQIHFENMYYRRDIGLDLMTIE